MFPSSDRRTCVVPRSLLPEEASTHRLFFKGVLPGRKPTVTITLQTTSASVRVAASRTQRIAV